MSLGPKYQKYLDTLRLSDAELATVLSEHLGQRAGVRRWFRRRTDLMPMTVDVDQPGGSAGKFLVRSYNLSEGGVGFFTGNYLHTGSRCRLGLTTSDNENISVDGIIAHCTNVWGRIHLAGVEFDSTIELSWFGEDADQNRVASDGQAVSLIDDLKALVIRSGDPEAIREQLNLLSNVLGMRKEGHNSRGKTDSEDNKPRGN